MSESLPDLAPGGAAPAALGNDSGVRGRNLARGMALLTVTSGVYIATGYAITVWLAHHLGPDDFGRYGVVAAIITLVNIAVARGVPVAATRAIASDPDTADHIMAVATRAIGPVVLAATILAAIAAYPVAVALGDRRIWVPLLIGAAAALSYAVQALSLAWFTGMHRYARQAVAQAWYAISRLVTIIVGGGLAGLTGAIAGSVLAPAIAALATLPRLRAELGRSRGVHAEPSAASLTAWAMVRASAPLVGVAALISALLTVDLLAFKRVGTAGDVGRYAAAATIAHVPFFLLRSAPIVVMPAVAAAHAASPGMPRSARSPAVQEEIRRGVGDTIVMLALPTALLVSLGDRAVEVVFGSSYAVDGLVVAPLALATAAITLYTVLVAVETALGRLRVALAAGVLGLALVATAAAIGGQGSNASRAAWAVAIAATLTFLLHAISVWSRTGWFVPPRAFAAVALACAIGAATLATPSGEWWLATVVLAACAAYGIVAVRLGLMRLR